MASRKDFYTIDQSKKTLNTTDEEELQTRETLA